MKITLTKSKIKKHTIFTVYNPYLKKKKNSSN